jgi:pimeloyl-ACP methyl ester carboxylesterase
VSHFHDCIPDARISTRRAVAQKPCEAYEEISRAENRVRSDSQMPVAAAAFDTAVTVAALHDKPTYGIVATDDRVLNPKLARWMFKRSRAKVSEVKASHLVYISHPDAVAPVIETAARALK